MERKADGSDGQMDRWTDGQMDRCTDGKRAGRQSGEEGRRQVHVGAWCVKYVCMYGKERQSDTAAGAGRREKRSVA